MAHGIARRLNVTPWQALLEEVKRSAGTLAWLDWKVGQAETDEELVGDGPMAEFVRMRSRERVHLARVSKMALDAGVAERLVAQYETEAQDMARFVLTTLEQLGLTEQQWTTARQFMRRELTAMAADARTLEGEEVTE